MSELSQEDYENMSNNFENNIGGEKIHEKNKKNHNSRFLLQLYTILEEDKYKNIIHWGDNGKYFIIENIHDFTEKILPKYYNHNNYSSFVRQLNMYDFHKKKTNENGHTFQHEKFIKGEKDLIKTIIRKRKKGKNNNITSLIPLNTELVKYNTNNYLNMNLSNDKYSLSLDEDKDKDSIQNNIYNNNIEKSLITYKNNNIAQDINEQIANTIKLKQNLLAPNNNNINNNINYNINNIVNGNNIIKNNNNVNNGINLGNKKITKKNIYDSLNCLLKKIQQNTKSQQNLNNKMDLLYNKNIDYINKNKTILDEMKSKIDYNKKVETIVRFILEIQKIKKEGSLKNILISNDINNNHIDDNSKDLNNLEILNLSEPKKETNGLSSSNNFLQKKTYNNGNSGIIEPFQSFLNKYMEKNKNIGLLTNEETIKNNNILNNKNETLNKKEDNNKIDKEPQNEKEKENNINDLNINNNNLKDTSFDNKENRSPSFDFTSSIFNRKRSSSFNSLFSNNTNNYNENFNNEFPFKKYVDSNNKNNNIIFGNNNQNNDNYYIGNGNLNKSFDIDFNLNNNSERKDSFNNSFISSLDIGNKTDKIGDIFGGDNSINFA